jgi:ferredoxin-NADP reductase
MKSVSAGVRAFLSDVAEVAGLLATPLVPSHYIALLRPLAATHTRLARVESVREETADTRTLSLRPGRGWRSHRPGQHVRITLAIDGRLATRTYSISSSPDRSDGCFAITVKAQGRVSRALVRDVAVGSYLSIGTAEGGFVLPDDPPPALALITAGSGITPVMSMLRTLAMRDSLSNVAHVHHARHARDVIFGDELRALAASHPGYRLTIIHTHDDPRRFEAARLDELVPDWRARETWACGPQGLLDAVTGCFAEAGHGDALHVERFTAALAPAGANDNGGRVRFANAGTERKCDGRTPLLRVAEDAGVRAPHGCRMGICHTCDTMLLSGRVRDLRTGETIEEPGTRIQVCVCAAAGDVELAL